MDDPQKSIEFEGEEDKFSYNSSEELMAQALPLEEDEQDMSEITKQAFDYLKKSHFILFCKKMK